MALHHLQELDEDEDRSEDPEAEGQADQVGRSEAAVAEEPERKQRRSHSRFPQYEDKQQDSTTDQGADTAAEAVRQCEERQRNGQDSDGYIEPEDRFPAPALHHGAADQGSKGHTQAGDARVACEGR